MHLIHMIPFAIALAFANYTRLTRFHPEQGSLAQDPQQASAKRRSFSLWSSNPLFRLPPSFIANFYSFRTLTIPRLECSHKFKQL